ncbi:hypothetical protein [Paraoerskovia sediminicola]|uniref:hypothetical protein n=1 Tax=Paraoerskovia sediminicola TaxID=1138587 RepID=UPI0025739351|nr:hypothetical protein [Paraoerskovia sediminicola]
MNSSTGIVALMLVVLWLAYFLPTRVQQRQQLLDSQLGDRFSGSLRVLAVAGGSPRGSAPDVARTGRRTADAHLPGAAPVLMIEQHERPRPMSSTYAPRPVGGDGASRLAPTGLSPARSAMLARRAAAARRRLILTLGLLVVTVGVVVAAAVGVLAWAVVAVPAALLVAVLVLGRRASASAARSDAAWHAERRARAASRASRDVVGAPVVPRRATGHAVRRSAAETGMIPRVASPATSAGGSKDGVGSGDGGSEIERAREAARAAADDETRTEVIAVVEAPVGTAAGAKSAPAAAAPTATAPATATESDDDLGRAWNPVPVPRPTYTMKPAAPRREPAPLTDATPTVRRGDAGPVRTAAPAAATPAAVHPESLGVDLNQVLARRRAAGQ